MRLRSIVAENAEKLRDISDTPRLDVEVLLAEVLDVSRTWLFTHAEDDLTPDAVARLDALVERRRSGEPVAYITGEKEFWSLTLKVSPATLVPRPETERLVEVALELLAGIGHRHQRVADLGTGSGAIALALATERDDLSIAAVDVSADALAVAEENARRHNIDNVEFIESDWVDELDGKPFDLVVTNPPYVAEDDPALDRLGAEPRLALTSGPDGLDAITRLAVDVRRILRIDGHLLVEHGADQEADVHRILVEHGWKDVHCFTDYARRPRVTSATFRG